MSDDLKLEAVRRELSAAAGLLYRWPLYAAVERDRGVVEFWCVSEDSEYTQAGVQSRWPGLVDLTVFPHRFLGAARDVRADRGPAPNEMTVSWAGDPQAVIDVRETADEIAVVVRDWTLATGGGSLLPEPQQSAVVQLGAPAKGRRFAYPEKTDSGSWARVADLRDPVLPLAAGPVALLDTRPAMTIRDRAQRTTVDFAYTGDLGAATTAALPATFQRHWQPHRHSAGATADLISKSSQDTSLPSVQRPHPRRMRSGQLSRTARWQPHYERQSSN